MPNNESKARILVGKIVSDKMDKTIVVKVERKLKDPLYGKMVKRSIKLHAHDEIQQGKIGDTVRIQESRPISKTKTWVLVDIIS